MNQDQLGPLLQLLGGQQQSPNPMGQNNQQNQSMGMPMNGSMGQQQLPLGAMGGMLGQQPQQPGMGNMGGMLG